MSYDIFIKKLESNESGYSGNKPDQRGKFILISKEFYDFFPYLSKLTLNDQAVMRCKISGNHDIAVNIVYHNAKYFPQTHERAHNEVRLYRNSKLDEVLNLDRGVIVVATKFDNGSYGFTSIQKNNSNYEVWKEIAKNTKNNSAIYDSIKKLSETKQLIDLDNNDNKDIQNSKEVIDQFTARLIKTRKQHPEFIHADDPAKPLQNIFNTQSAFTNYVREMYGGKCAMRGTSLIFDNFSGLEAAHIRADEHKGPLLPTNGILLSNDLHKAFDDGFFTLNEENNVIVSKKVPKNSNLWGFNDMMISPIIGYETFKPFKSYTKWHHDEIFERRF